MNIIFGFCFLLCFIILCVSLFYLYTEIYNIKNKDMILSIQDHFCSISFDTIYKDQLLPYDLSGYKPNETNLETARRNFIRFTFELMGKNNKRILIRFYGSSSTLTTNILMDFTTRFEKDKLASILRKQQEQQAE